MTSKTAFVVEDLNIKGMVNNRKLARTLHDIRWGDLLVFLSSQCERAGKTMYNMGRSEPTCNVCS
jgi:putative transposase